MIAYKCKICGGNLQVENEAKIATCEFCGSTHSLPNIENDKIRNLYERANQLRRNHEFDKAMGIYETILTEDTNDGEAYWSLVLCKYGVEYVEDPKSKKRVITCHRTLPQSASVDQDFKKALNLANPEVKILYQAEAKQIDEIQKGILSISSHEDPFDIFICYKETDNVGKRTIDSVLAQDLYDELTDQGFKVFFAKITLEDKLGQQYEPYIYSALTTAKVMLVLGTRKDYFEAPWVRNEWSRFLAMMKADKKKMLVPLYRDIDAYDLPEEFRIFQSQDLNKVGAIQDLIRGLKKIIATPISKGSESHVQVANIQEPKNFTTLLKRAMLALEDQDFDSAETYAEKMLDIDPENAEVYLVKWLIDEKVSTIEERFAFASDEEFIMKKASLHSFNQFFEQPFDTENSNYLKIRRFGMKTIIPKFENAVERAKSTMLHFYDEHLSKLINDSNSDIKYKKKALEQVSDLVNLLKAYNYPDIQKRFDDALHETNALLAIDQAKNHLSLQKDDFVTVLEILTPFLSYIPAKKFYDDLLEEEKALTQKKLEDIANEKLETYKKISNLIKNITIQNLQEAIKLGQSLLDYEDIPSLIAFSKQKLKELLNNRLQKRLRIIAVISGISVLVGSITFVLMITLPLNQVIQDGATYHKEGNHYILKDYQGDGATAFVMPNGIRGLPVEVIDQEAFFSSNIQSVKIGYFVREIRSRAFKQSQISTINLNPLLTVIGEEAFANTKLNAIHIPNSVEAIGANILNQTTTLKEISLPYIGLDKANPSSLITFLGSSSGYEIENFRINNQETLIPNALEGFRIASLSISKITNTISLGSFSGISNLQLIDLPFLGKDREDLINNFLAYGFGATSIQDQTTMVPQSLKTVKVHDDLTIEPFALANLSHLETMIFYEGTRKINSYAITQSTGLQKVFMSRFVEVVSSFAILNTGNPQLLIEHEDIPSTWSQRWNADNLNVIWGTTIDEI